MVFFRLSFPCASTQPACDSTWYQEPHPQVLVPAIEVPGGPGRRAARSRNPNVRVPWEACASCTFVLLDRGVCEARL